MRYAVDSERQSMVATGVEPSPVMVWEEVGGKRRPSETEQERDPDTGMPLWQIEVMYRQLVFGRENTVTAMVKCGAVDAPQVGQFSPVSFKGLTVEVRTRATGGATEYWAAEEFVPAAGKPSSSSTPAAGSGKSAESKAA
ncbi:hypothetical protein MU582_12000 [Nocardioidaceae bacterium SCSIO 66511]|nr:hypothetical protein MU582_12000 [Nocardioidaceae bacterium SCSIO 66511]